MNIILQINGGLGKCIVATAITEIIKKKYPNSKLIVVSGYPDVFLNNPYVDRAFNFGEHSYFYSDYIEDKEFKLLAHDPYLETNHINKTEHLIETWCKLFDLEYNGEQPNIYLTEREINFFSRKYTTDKPIMVIQTNGGVEQNLKYSWARDIPSHIVENVIEKFKYGYTIFHLKREDQMSFSNTIPVTDTFRSIATLIAISDKRFFMDSFGQHVAGALKLESTVLWVVNSPKVFGYETNKNITSKPFTKKAELKMSYINKFNIQGEPLEFPYNSEFEMFDIDDVINSLSNNEYTNTK
jgi:hypothetical protein